MAGYGFRFSDGEDEQLYLRHLFAFAMAHRSPVRVSFFKQKKDDHGRPVRSGGRDLYVKVTRVVEPHELIVTKSGHRAVKVVDRTPEGEFRPDYRTIRLDRITFSRPTGKPIAHVLAGQGYLCPSLLDGRELYPRKRVLTSV